MAVVSTLDADFSRSMTHVAKAQKSEGQGLASEVFFVYGSLCPSPAIVARPVTPPYLHAYKQ